MVLPMILGGLGRMGLGIGTATLGGLGMGFGYGYGVRAGYNSYKPSKNKKTNDMVLSSNPITAGTGMGLHVAEQRFPETATGTNATDTPTPEITPDKPRMIKSKVSNLELPLSRFSSDQEIKNFQLYGKLPRTKRITNSSIY